MMLKNVRGRKKNGALRASENFGLEHFSELKNRVPFSSYDRVHMMRIFAAN